MSHTRVSSTVEPLFVKEDDMPSADIAPLTVVRAIVRVTSPQAVDGVQRIGRLWRIYMKSVQCRLDLLTQKSIMILGRSVSLYEQNPFKTNQASPNDQKDKLTIKGLPLSVSNEEIKSMLEDKGVVLSSSIMYACMRNEDGSLTSYRNGDRYLYCNPLPQSIPRQQRVCGFYCTVYHHGRDNGRECKSCTLVGHKPGDPSCPALPEADSILAFSGYQHVLSNHYMTPICAFGMEEPFKSVEHAFFFKMATDMGYKDLADRIMNAEHAGVVKRLSKDMAEDERRTWEESNVSVMKQLLTEKARTCEHFKQCLIMSKDKVLAEATGNKHWGTGMNAWITERTKPNCWPGSNLMGLLLMDLTEELMHDTDFSIAMETQDDENAGSGDEKSVSDDKSVSDEDINGTQQASSTGNSSNAGVIQNTQQEKSASEKKPKPSKSKKKTAPNGTNASTKDKRQSKDNKTTNKVNPPIQEKSSKDSVSGNGKPSSSTKEKSWTNVSPGKGLLPTILQFFDPVTGKRKTPDTTPEKQHKEKKVNAR